MFLHSRLTWIKPESSSPSRLHGPAAKCDRSSRDNLSGATFATDWLHGLAKWRKFAGDTPTRKPLLIYGGDESHEREGCLLTGWRDLAGWTVT